MRGALVVLLLLTFNSCSLLSQESATDSIPVAVSFSSHDGRSVVPFDLIQDSIYFRVMMNGKTPLLWFSLDTGSGSTYLDTRKASRLGLRNLGRSQVKGAGAGTVQVEETERTGFQFSGLRTSNQQLKTTDLSGLQAIHPMDGFFGYDLLRQVVVVIDYQSRRMTFIDPVKFHFDGHGYVAPITFHGHWPFIQGKIKVPGQPELESDFLVDTGSGDAVNHPIILKSTGPLRRTQTGNGLGTPVSGAIGKIEYFQLGPYRIAGLTSVCCGGNDEASRQIGGSFLSRFTLILDYPGARMIFIPNRSLHDAK